MPSPSKLGVEACRRRGSGRAPCRGSWRWSRGRRGRSGPWASTTRFSAKSSPPPRSVLTPWSPKAVSRLPSARVAGEQEVAVDVRAERVAGDDDLAVGRQRDAVGDVVGAEVGDRRAAVPERGVERAVGRVAREGDVLARGAGDDDPAVRAGSRARGRRRLRVPRSVVTMPSVPKLVVERAVGVVADEREVAVDAVAASANPATTILPSGWTATALAWSPPPRMSVLTIPPLPKPGSGVPSGAVADDAEVELGEARGVGAADGDDPAVGRAARRRRPRRRRRRGRWWRSRRCRSCGRGAPAASWRVSAKSTPRRRCRASRR